MTYAERMPDRIDDAAPVEAVGPRPRRRLRDRWVLLTVLIMLGVLVGGSLLAIGGLAARLSSNVQSIADPFAALPSRPPIVTPTPTPGVTAPGVAAPTRPAMNVLVLGSDSRISAGNPADWVAGAQRTDAIMLVHLPADAKAAWVMSIPRDSWVAIPGHGMAKINAAYSYGGPTLLIHTIESLTNVRIDHFAVADFESFQQVTDALGGVPLTLKENLLDRQGNFMLAAGQQVLNGEQALIWVRERYSLPRGDFDRVQRQQAWMRAILTKVRDEGVLSNPIRSVRFLDTVTRSLAVDDGVTFSVMQDMIGRVKNLGSGDLHFLTVPVSGTGWSPDGQQSIVNLNRPAFNSLMAAVANDTVGQYLEAHSKAVDTLGAVAP